MTTVVKKLTYYIILLISILGNFSMALIRKYYTAVLAINDYQKEWLKFIISSFRVRLVRDPWLVSVFPCTDISQSEIWMKFQCITPIFLRFLIIDIGFALIFGYLMCPLFPLWPCVSSINLQSVFILSWTKQIFK